MEKDGLYQMINSKCENRFVFSVFSFLSLSFSLPLRVSLMLLYITF